MGGLRDSEPGEERQEEQQQGQHERHEQQTHQHAAASSHPHAAEAAHAQPAETAQDSAGEAEAASGGGAEEAEAEPGGSGGGDEEEWQQIHAQLRQALEAEGISGGGEGACIADMDAGEEDEWQDVTGGTLLAVFQCCEAGQAAELAALLQRSAAPGQPLLDVNAPGPDGDTALNLACLYGHDACVSELLRHGADPSIVNKVDGSTVLHDAAAGGYLDICKTILGRAPGLVKIADEDGDTPLHNAARGNHAEVVQLLLSSGAEPLAVNAEGNTPAAEAEEEAVVEMLQHSERRARAEQQRPGGGPATA